MTEKKYKCAKKDCKFNAKAWFNRKRYCQYHFNIKVNGRKIGW